MHTPNLRQQRYPILFLIRLLVGVIRLLFDLPSFFFFLLSGRVDPRPRARP
ncbi:MAG TPA: hypothetical protein VI755_11515 [Anaerolineales bacterium]|nr:hypothetical protein [Anaerolineales bacterium]